MNIPFHFAYLHMSSHHFVKEGQEPALLIFNTDIEISILKELLEWCPRVIITSDVIAFIQQWSIKVDAIICLEVEIEEIRANMAYQMPLLFLPVHDRAQFWKAALTHLHAQNQRAINVIGSKENMDQLMAPDLSVVLWEEEIRWTKYQKNKIRKWIAKGQKLIVDPQHITIGGNYEIMNVSSSTDTVITTQEDGFIEITSDANIFWLGEYWN